MPDRIFNFSIAALVLSVGALVYLMLWPVLEIEEVVGDVITISSVSVIASGNIWAVIISTFPTLIVAGSIFTLPRSGRVQRNHKINVAVGAIVLWVFVIMFSRQIGVVYIPAATMLTSVVVLTLVRERAWGKDDAFATDEEAHAHAAALAPKRKPARIGAPVAPDRVGRRPRRRARSRRRRP